MRTRPLTALLPSAALVLGALAAPAGAAPPNDATYRGRCFLVVANETTQTTNPADYWTGYVGAAVGLYAPTLGHNPVSGQVDCTVRVNGAPVTSANDTGTAAVAFAAPVGFTAQPNDWIGVCTEVAATDAHGGTNLYSDCTNVLALTVEWPGPVVASMLLAFCDMVNDYTLCNLVMANQARVLVVT